MEDHEGDMDFKVAGTDQGITALQMDIKIKGINEDILREALEQARVARLEILKNMNETIKESRKELSQYAPKVKLIKIKPKLLKSDGSNRSNNSFILSFHSLSYSSN